MQTSLQRRHSTSKSSSECEIIPITAAQQSMRLFEQLYPKTPTYHHTVAIELKGKLDVSVLQKALMILVERHKTLNSFFSETNQFIPRDSLPSINAVFEVVDATKNQPNTLDKLEVTLKALNKEGILFSPFSIEKGPLWRGALIQLASQHFQLILVFHHIIMDVTSQNILLKELSIIYNSISDEKAIDLPKLPSLGSVAESAEDKLDVRLDHWKKTLANLQPTSLYTEESGSSQPTFKGTRLPIGLSQEESYGINKLMESEKVSAHVILMGTLITLLHHYTNQTDFCIGTPSANRRRDGIENLVNCFINSVPLRIQFSPDLSFKELLPKIKEIAKASYENQAPIDLITKEILSSNTAITTPFDIMLNVNEPKTTLELNNISASQPIEIDLGTAKFKNFGINLDKQLDKSYQGFLEVPESFQRNYSERLINHWKTIINHIIKNPDAKIRNIFLLTTEEKKMLEKCNPPPEQKAIHDQSPGELLSFRAHQTPDKDFLVFHDQNNRTAVNYKTIDDHSTQLAFHLLKTRESTVGVCLPRSNDLILSFFAVFKSGKTLIPLETAKTELLKHKISDGNIKIILVNNQTKNLFDDDRNIQLINLDTLDLSKKNKEFDNIELPKYNPTQLAYIIYTSGTTGKPKGVMIPYSALMNMVDALTDRNYKKASKVLCTAPPTFDAIFFEIFQSLVVEKGELHLIHDGERLSGSKMTAVIQQEKIGIATLTPAVIKQLDPAQVDSLYDVITMGATPDKALLAKWLQAKIKIRNEWGPTENTICSTAHECKVDEPYTVIGNPIRNVQLFIVNPNTGTECPIGVPGEIWASGKQVAIGYLNDTELSAKKFPTLAFDPEQRCFFESLAENKDYGRSTLSTNSSCSSSASVSSSVASSFNSSQKTPLIKIYRTGDLAVRLHNGEINFLGRIDNQLKLKSGLRIEPDGIRNLLCETFQLQDALIEISEDKERLIAYLITDKTIPQEDIFSALDKSTIDRAAWPDKIICLENIPLRESGKVDTAKLRELEAGNKIKKTQPTTSEEKIMRELWAETLGIKADMIGIDDTFADLGGKSLHRATLASKINSSSSLQFQEIVPTDITKLTTIKILLQQCHAPSLLTNFNLFGANNNAATLLSPTATRPETPAFFPCSSPTHN